MIQKRDTAPFSSISSPHCNLLVTLMVGFLR
jgi:hypothetical protein